MVANIGERLGSLSVRADAHLGAIISDSVRHGLTIQTNNGLRNIDSVALISH